jgi:hypothetical protein
MNAVPGIRDALRPNGTGYPAQIVLGLITSIVVFIVMFGAEYIYRLSTSIDKTRVRLLDITASSSAKPYIFKQNPADGGSKTLYLSNNERSGIEFSYSFYIFLNPDNGTTTNSLYHVFHKGYATQYPLLGPGVYMHSNENTMRVYMNTYTKWDNYVDIPNFPVKKWVHVVVSCEGNSMIIYVNGNVARRMIFDSSVPYQNFQDVYVFNNRIVRVCPSGQTCTSGVENALEEFNVSGAFKGMLSNLSYFNYALSYSEIAGLMHEGPSKKTDPMDESTPPYLADTWWSGE